MTDQYAPYLTFIQRHLTQPRIDHSIRVAETAKHLAIHHGANPDTCYLAGILHDVAKQLTPNNAKENGFQITEQTNRYWDDYPLIWHQFAGAEMVEKTFGNLPNQVAVAIRSHTTGCPDMDLVSQILFLADYFEPERKYETKHLIQKLSYKNLDSATFALASLSIKNLISRQIKIFPNSIDCYNFYLGKIGLKNVRVIGNLLNPWIN